MSKKKKVMTKANNYTWFRVTNGKVLKERKTNEKG